MSLLDSARVFLIESLDNYYSRDKMAFSIVHAMIAVELLLKERLFRIHECLIYEDIDLTNIKKQNTVKLSVIPQRLKNLGIELKGEDCELIKKITGWRNSIVHHLPTHNNQAANAKLELLYNFIISFLVNELGEKFHDFLPKKYYLHMEKIIDELNREIVAAKHKANESGHPDNDNRCPICDIIGVVEIKDEDSAYCHLCMQEIITLTCAGCESPLHGYSKVSSSYEAVCNTCLERGRDEYIDREINKLRGK